MWDSHQVKTMRKFPNRVVNDQQMYAVDHDPNGLKEERIY